MKISNLKMLSGKELIIFDLDGTVAPSKSPMDSEMAKLIKSLLGLKKVAIISGGRLQLFDLELLKPLAKQPGANLHNLFLFPTTSTAFYCHRNGKWHRVYAHMLSKAEVKRIYHAFEKVFDELGYNHPKKVYGKVIENRGSQVTFSALGQDIVAVLGKKGLQMKEEWTKKNTPLKLKIARAMQKKLPALSVWAAGHTSIDVTRKGIDKAYGVRQIKKHLKVPIAKMLFVGDAIFPGGNDYAVLKTGIDYVAVKNPEETKKLIKKLISI
jgi:HAD superfamily hydrolase (TIGR01484 family)